MPQPLGYTTRSKVEKFLQRSFSEVDNTEFNDYILAAESYINNYLGYNAQTTTSGILQESVVREKSIGKIDSEGNLVVDLAHPPVAFDSNGNPLVSLLEFNKGAIRIALNLTDGSNSALNTVLEVSENRRKVTYPSLYFFPAISTVTPTAKMNLFYLQDVKFWVDISYIGGYPTVPADIQQAANLIVGDQLLNRDNPGNVISYRQGSFSIDYGQTRKTGISDNFAVARHLLEPYVRYTW